MSQPLGPENRVFDFDDRDFKFALIGVVEITFGSDGLVFNAHDFADNNRRRLRNPGGNWRRQNDPR